MTDVGTNWGQTGVKAAKHKSAKNLHYRRVYVENLIIIRKMDDCYTEKSPKNRAFRTCWLIYWIVIVGRYCSSEKKN